MSGLPLSGDGTLPTGAFDITILEETTAAAAAYQLDSFSVDENASRVKSKSPRGRNSRNKVIIEDETFSADCQLADEDHDAPRPRMTFAIDANRDGAAEPYMIEKVGRTFMQDGEWKCKLSGFACVCPLPYVSTASGHSGDRTNASTVAITTLTFQAYMPRGVTQTAATFTATGLPAGLTIDATTGAITGTPTTPSVNTVTIKNTGTRNVDGTTETLIGARKFIWTIT